MLLYLNFSSWVGLKALIISLNYVGINLKKKLDSKNVSTVMLFRGQKSRAHFFQTFKSNSNLLHLIFCSTASNFITSVACFDWNGVRGPFWGWVQDLYSRGCVFLCYRSWNMWSKWSRDFRNKKKALWLRQLNVAWRILCNLCLVMVFLHGALK